MSLWKGTTFSHGDEGGDGGIEEQGHASPRGTPSIVVRVDGQTLERLLMRTDQSVGTVMIGIAAATVVGCERRKSGSSQLAFLPTTAVGCIPSMCPGLPSRPK